MREVTGDLWDFYDHGAHVAITTNGSLTTKGRAVLGRGVAREATIRFPTLPDRLGASLHAAYQAVPDDIPLIYYADWELFAFPVKWAWFDPADPDLIMTSAQRLMTELDALNLPMVYIVRPGCGNGHLAWTHVRPLIESIFDHRVTIVQRCIW